MARSAESLARRAAYGRAWRANHAAEYQSDWRKRHRAEENERVARWRAANPVRLAEQKARYAEAHRRLVDTTPLPEPFLGHELFTQALAVVGPDTSTWSVWKDPLHEDLMSVAVLALVEGVDPVEAVRKARAAESSFRYRTAPFMVDGTEPERG